MIEVAVGIEQIFDRLIRDQPLRLGNDRAGVGFAIASFEYYDVVLEVDCDTGVSTKNEVNTVSQRA